jgi:hypothetical protein
MPENAATATRGNTEIPGNTGDVIKQLIPNLMDLAWRTDLRPLQNKGGIKNGY